MVLDLLQGSLKGSLHTRAPAVSFTAVHKAYQEHAVCRAEVRYICYYGMPVLFCLSCISRRSQCATHSRMRITTWTFPLQNLAVLLGFASSLRQGWMPTCQ